jgi:hypothetical protein
MAAGRCTWLLTSAYQPLSWLELEAGLRVAAVMAHGRERGRGRNLRSIASLEPGLLLAPTRGITLLPPLAGSRIDLRAGRFGGPGAAVAAAGGGRRAAE